MVQPLVLKGPLDLEAVVARIYARDASYPLIVLRDVPMLLAEIRRLRALLAVLGGAT